MFDAERNYQLGIMSRKFQGRPYGAHPVSELNDIAKYFVPALFEMALKINDKRQ